MKCPICAAPDSFKEELVRYCDREGPEPFFVENVPAFVCIYCGERAVPAAALAVIKGMRLGQGKPIDVVEVPVFDYEDLAE